MSVVRLDNVAIVVNDLDAAIRFFEEVGLALEGRAQMSGPGVDHCVGLPGVTSEIAVLATPDGHGRVELTTYLEPVAAPSSPPAPPPNTIGLHRVMFAVDDIDDTVARLSALGATVLDEIVQYEDSYRLCYLRGPDGIILALAQQLGD